MKTNTGRNRNRGSEQLPARGVWWTAEQACDALGVGPRALRTKAQAGTLDRRKVGRRSFYALPVDRTPKANLPDRESGSAAILGLACRDSAEQIEAKRSAFPAAVASVADADLVPRLVSQLTADLGRAREERGEAVAIGFMLAEQRDTLAGELAAVKARLSSLAAELRTLPWYARTRRAEIALDLARLV